LLMVLGANPCVPANFSRSFPSLALGRVVDSSSASPRFGPPGRLSRALSHLRLIYTKSFKRLAL